MRYQKNWIKHRLMKRKLTHSEVDNVDANISKNIEKIHQLFDGTPDLVTYRFKINQTGKSAFLIYIDGLVDKSAINDHILRPLLYEVKSHNTEDLPISIANQGVAEVWEDIESAFFLGKSILFIDGNPSALILDTQGWPQRHISEPQIESSLKGAHQGFIESREQNIALIMRYLPDRDLKYKGLIVGRRGKTNVSLLYLADLVHPEVLQELEDRIRQVDIDAIINTGELEELIEDNPFTPFPQFLTTERPDAAASHILQGRIAVLIDKTPGVLIGPMTLMSFFQTVDDYSTRWIIASFFRLLRFFGFFIGISLPSFYIAALSFHYEIIPLDLLISIGESREKVPFPPILEALIMEVVLEMLREAGLRLPAPIGQTVGIVGGIVIGQAAVQAGIVSNIMVIIVSLTAISSFILPNPDLSAAVRFIRFPMMLTASIFGMVGIVIGFMIIIGHLISLESLGTPYGSPLAPVRFSDLKDSFVRFPLWKMVKRPLSAHPTELIRQGNNRKRGDGK